MDLAHECRVKLLIRPETTGIAGLQTDLATAYRIYAVMQRHLQYLRHVQITGQHVRLLPESAHLDATAATSLAGVTQRLALPHQLLHVHIRLNTDG